MARPHDDSDFLAPLVRLVRLARTLHRDCPADCRVKREAEAVDGALVSAMQALLGIDVDEREPLVAALRAAVTQTRRALHGAPQSPAVAHALLGLDEIAQLTEMLGPESDDGASFGTPVAAA